MTAISVLARPKINLFLHVTGKRADGYHTLESLAVFAGMGDRVQVEPGAELSLSVDGPFSEGLDAGCGNLVLRAALALQDWARANDRSAPGAAIHLTKNLPVASGIGGGSADAAATLKALCKLWRLEIPDTALAALALGLGADVPVCLESRPRMMRGVGEELSEAPALPAAWLVLANPGLEVATPAVFAKLETVRSSAVSVPDGFADTKELADWLLRETRNDLEAPARELAPEIGDVLAALNDCVPLFARMSGSGATCYGLFADENAAAEAKKALRSSHSGWWIEAAPIRQ